MPPKKKTSSQKNTQRTVESGKNKPPNGTEIESPDSIRAKLELELAEQCQKDMQVLEKKHRQNKESLKKTHQESMAQIDADYKKQVSLIQSEHAKSLAEIETELKKLQITQKNNTQARYQSEIDKIDNAYREEIEKIEADEHSRLDAIKKASESRLAEKKAELSHKMLQGELFLTEDFNKKNDSHPQVSNKGGEKYNVVVGYKPRISPEEDFILEELNNFECVIIGDSVIEACLHLHDTRIGKKIVYVNCSPDQAPMTLQYFQDKDSKDDAIFVVGQLQMILKKWSSPLELVKNMPLKLQQYVGMRIDGEFKVVNLSGSDSLYSSHLEFNVELKKWSEEQPFAVFQAIDYAVKYDKKIILADVEVLQKPLKYRRCLSDQLRSMMLFLHHDFCEQKIVMACETGLWNACFGTDYDNAKIHRYQLFWQTQVLVRLNPDDYIPLLCLIYIIPMLSSNPESLQDNIQKAISHLDQTFEMDVTLDCIAIEQYVRSIVRFPETEKKYTPKFSEKKSASKHDANHAQKAAVQNESAQISRSDEPQKHTPHMPSSRAKERYKKK